MKERDMSEAGQVRRVVSEAEYKAAFASVENAANSKGVQVLPPTVCDMVQGVLASVGLLTPVPEADTEDGRCTAFFPDEAGDWWQCELDAHASSEEHDAGDWAWKDDAPNAVPAT